MRSVLVIAWSVLTVACAGSSVSESAAAEPTSTGQVDAAVGVAQQWVALIDTGKYGESWDASAQLFQQNVAREGWAGQVAAVREPIGAVKLRTVKSAEYMTTAPGAPDGEYVVVQFDTTFENKAAAVETITPMRDADGAWHVAGYFLR